MRENSYATLDSTGNVPLDQLANAAGGGPHNHAGEDITSGTVADARVASTLARDSEVTTAVSNHAAAADPHTGYRLESADHTHATTGLQGGTVAHSALTGLTAGDDHTQYQKESEKGAASGYASLDAGTKVPIAEVPTGTTGTTVALGNHAHTGTYEPSGTVATHEADTTSIHGIADTAALVVDGDAAGGELAGTYPNPTVASSHSGSTHAATQAAAEATAAGALAGHVAAGDPHTGYRLESADHSHATTGLQGGTVAHTALTSVGIDDHHARDHAIGGSTHTGAITAAQHGVLADAAAGHRHADLTGVTANQHHNQVHATDHAPTGPDPIDPYLQSEIGTADLAIANTETVVCQRTFAANELIAGATFMFKAYATRAGTTSASPVIRIRIGTTTLTGNIAATLTPPVNTLAVGNEIEGIVTIRSAGAGGTALGSLKHTVHLAAVTITEALGVSTATVAVNTTSANQRIELTFISGNAANTYTFRNAVIYRVN